MHPSQLNIIAVVHINIYYTWSAAWLQKFSEAMSSSPVLWRFFSAFSRSHITGSSVSRVSRPFKNMLLLFRALKYGNISPVIKIGRFCMEMNNFNAQFFKHVFPVQRLLAHSLLPIKPFRAVDNILCLNCTHTISSSSGDGYWPTSTFPDLLEPTPFGRFFTIFFPDFCHSNSLIFKLSIYDF